MLRHEFPAWTAAFSERADGDLRVSARTASEPLPEVQRRTLETLGVAAIVVGRQVHGSRVLVVAEDVEGYAVGLGEADAVATARPGVASAVHVGDCLPIAVGGEGAVAMLHGGWRGLAGGIVAAGVGALRELGAAGELQAMIGPCAGACCYETGEEVREIFARYDATRGRLLDLELVAAEQLREAGVENIVGAHRCTICDGRYFSHRRDGAASGRQGGFAWLR